VSELGVVSRARSGYISLHSHITGLGLDENGRARKIAGGLVGQEEAREAAGVIVEMIKEGRMSGKGILLAGPPGTGKTAIAIAIARELGEDTPFVAMNAGEVYSLEKKKTEVLMQAVRRAIGIRVREKRRVVEGVVAELKYSRRRTGFYPYPVLAGARITLETTDDSRTFTVGAEIAEQLLSQNVKKGDVIVIDVETGVVRKVGRGKGKAEKVYDIAVEREVDVPSGPVEKTKEFLRVFTLHDIDLGLTAQRVMFSGLFGLLEAEREISDEVRKRTNETVRKMLEEGQAELVPGVIFIDDAHLLDLESFSFLTKAMESEFAPVIILATNRGVTTVRGTDVKSPHGIPRDLLDRLLIITTRPYTEDEIKEIIRIRAEETDTPITEEALDELTRIGAERSLRYAIQLLEPSLIIASRRGSTKIEVQDVREAQRLFSDVKKSLETIEKYGELMMI